MLFIKKLTATKQCSQATCPLTQSYYINDTLRDNGKRYTQYMMGNYSLIITNFYFCDNTQKPDIKSQLKQI